MKAKQIYEKIGKFLKERLLGMAIFAIITGVISSLIYDRLHEINSPSSDISVRVPFGFRPTATVSRDEFAGEILKNIREQPTKEERRSLMISIYLGRWIPNRGWEAHLSSPPVKQPNDEGHWHLRLQEQGSDAIIEVSTTDDVSMLRTADPVRVMGWIDEISIHKISIKDATISSAVSLVSKPGG